MILEARDRIGGRILTVKDPLSPVPVELGAEFIHGVSPDLWSLVKRAHLPAVEVQGDSRSVDESEPDEDDGTDQIFQAMANVPEQSFADFLYTLNAPEQAKLAATGFVEGFNAARKEEVSVEWLNYENRKADEIEGDQSFRLLSGYEAIPHYLHGGLGDHVEVRYSTPVRRIRWQPGDVRAETDAGEIRAQQAIITVPWGVLMSGDLDIDPEPPALSAARQAIAMGDVVRVVLRLREPAWKPRLSFIFGGDDFPVWWTQYPTVAPVITGWAAGSRAVPLLHATCHELRDIATASLRKLFGNSTPPPEALHHHDWHGDSFSRGAYTYVRVGGLRAQQQLHLPVENTLYFAGEASDVSGHVGTVHGALATGLWAARHIGGGLS